MKPNLSGTAQTQKLYGLDHLRAFAISFVLLYHYRFFGHPAWIEPIAKFGWTGVDLFFVLSGYLISSHLFSELAANKRISLKNFFIKRSFRILPAYWFVVAVYFLVPPFREREALPPLWRFLTFTQDISLDLNTEGTFSHAWSLCVEEQFYLLLPMALLVIFRSAWFKKGGYILLLLAIAGFAARLLSWNLVLAYQVGKSDFNVLWYKYIYYLIYNRMDPLLIGIAVAALVKYQPVTAARLAKFGDLWLIAGLALLATAYFICSDARSYTATLIGFPMVALAYGTIVFGAVCPQSIFYRSRSRVTENIASLSFGIYLIHKGVIHLTQTLWNGYLDEDSFWTMLICIAFTMAGALMLRLIIEKPFLKIRQRLLTTE